jgi:hypothetical protein
VIDDRQRVAVDAIARPKLAVEVDGPHLIGRGRVQGRGAGILPVGARATASYTPVSRQDVEDGTSRRPLRRGILGLQSLQDLPRAPAVARARRGSAQWSLRRSRWES